MLLRRAELRNFCQHTAMDISFSPRLNMIVGANGSGKTNLLRAILLGLTGDAGGYCNKKDN